MQIQSIKDASFEKYGRVLEGYDCSELFQVMEQTPLPPHDVVYVASVEEMEQTAAAGELRDRAFGGLPIEIGYCNGNNRKLNAVEYHRSSEIDIAVNDLILLLGCQQDIGKDFSYDTAKIEAYLVPAGTAVELYATTLHFAPCTANGIGFRCVIVLPAGTNMELDACQTVSDGDACQTAGDGDAGRIVSEDRLLTAVNKWMIAHEEAGIEGAFCGLIGENVSV